MGKVQMFFFTLVAVVTYGSMLWSLFRSDGTALNEVIFPAVNTSLLAILGISHAGYLAEKTADHTQTNP